ncbi:hypothetical protein [Cupriavidus sp. 8B]
MSGISAVTPQVTLPGSTTPVKASSAGAADTQAGSTASTAPVGGPAAGAGAGKAGGGGSSSSSSRSTESDTVKELKKQIAALQKQLAQEQR